MLNFSKIRFQLVITSFIIMVSFTGITATLKACDMMAVLAKDGYQLTDFLGSGAAYGTLPKMFTFFEGISNPPNNDGYGSIFYKSNENIVPTQQRFHLKGYNDYYYGTAGPNCIPFNNFKDEITDFNNNATIALSHARNASNENSPGNHPFWFDYDEDLDGETDITYTFQHNGDCTPIKSDLIDFVIDYDSNWFVNHPSNWNADPEDPFVWIDSEALFHYIMTFVIENNGDVINGITQALNLDEENPYNFKDYFRFDSENYRINFVLSDGEALYVFRNNHVDNLSYIDYGLGFVSVKTQDIDATMGYGHLLDRYSLVKIPRHGETQIFNDIFTEENYVSGTIYSDQTWTEDHYIIGDLTIADGVKVTVSEEASLLFAGKHELTVNGELVIEDDSYLRLSNHSLIDVNGANAKLDLEWGSYVYGYEQALKCFDKPGDRIEARNGGEIKAGDIDIFSISNPQEPVTIGSSSEGTWEGFRIYPNSDVNYSSQFTNCDVSGIEAISLFGDGNTGTLNLNYSTFDGLSRINVNDSKLLKVKGSENNRCEFKNFGTTALMVYGTDIDIEYANIHDNWYAGIYIAYQTDENSESIIKNSLIQNNGRDGIYFNDYWLKYLSSNTISDNGGHGVYSRDGLVLIDIDDNTIKNNAGTEFIGESNFFLKLVDGTNLIEETSRNNQGPWSQYVLAALDWINGNDPIDVSGNTIPHTDPLKFYPTINAFDFIGGDTPTIEGEQLNLALGMVSDESYETAKPVLEDIISTYPESNEAGTALRTLYYIENQTDKDFSELRNYLVTIQASDSSALAKTITDVEIKTYMKEKNYLSAINKIEDNIQTLTNDDEIIYAMIDEAYNQLMELNSGTGDAVFAGMAVNIKSEKDYFTITEDLMSRLSIYEGLEREDNPELGIRYYEIEHKNYPNPFNPSTTIAFNIPVAENVTVAIYNIKGQMVKTLINNKSLQSGNHTVVWNGNNESGSSFSSGMFIYSIKTKNATAFKKILLAK